MSFNFLANHRMSWLLNRSSAEDSCRLRNMHAGFQVKHGSLNQSTVLSRFTDKDRTDSWLFGRGWAVLFVWSGCQFFYLCRWKVSGLDSEWSRQEQVSNGSSKTRNDAIYQPQCLFGNRLIKITRSPFNLYDAYRLHARKQKVKPPVTYWLFVGRQMFRLVEIPCWNVIDEINPGNESFLRFPRRSKSRFFPLLIARKIKESCQASLTSLFVAHSTPRRIMDIPSSVSLSFMIRPAHSPARNLSSKSKRTCSAIFF